MAEQTTALVPAQQIKTLRDYLEKGKDRITAIVPKYMSAERLLKVALMACSRQPKLLACSQESILRGVMQAAEVGLEAGSLLGEAYLVPFGKEAVCIFGYRGLIQLARRSGEILSIEAHVVFKQDVWRFSFGLNPCLEHIPSMEPWMAEDERGERYPTVAPPSEMVCAYAVARLQGGGVQVDVMSKPEIDRIRLRSKAANDGPWVTDYYEMAKKTAVRRLCKYLPLSPEMRTALDTDTANDSDFITIPETPPEKPKGAEGAKEAIRQRRATAEAPPSSPAEVTDEELQEAFSGDVVEVPFEMDAEPPPARKPRQMRGV